MEENIKVIRSALNKLNEEPAEIIDADGVDFVPRPPDILK